MRRLIVLVALLLVVPSVIAQYDPCQSNNDCSQGYYCIGGFCLEPCNDDSDCQVGTCLQNGYCGTSCGNQQCDDPFDFNNGCPQECCGNGITNFGETCDDGNTNPGDGCDAQCQLEQATCGNTIVEAGEECDDGNTIPGDGCDAQCQFEGCGDGDLDVGEECDPGDPGEACDTGSTCNSECFCDKEANFVLFDLALGHNMLFSKVMDLLHIIKESLFQLEIKTIEIQLTDFECDQQPVSFWIPADLSPYGKLNEIDALIRLLIQAINDGGPANFGSPDLSSADTKLDDAECLIAAGEFRNAFNCKCLAYRNDLLDAEDGTVVCNDCTD